MTDDWGGGRARPQAKLGWGWYAKTVFPLLFKIISGAKHHEFDQKINLTPFLIFISSVYAIGILKQTT